MALPLCWSAAKLSGKGCASLGTSREKTLSLSGDLERGKLERVPALAAELVRLKVDVIVTDGSNQPAEPRKQLLRFPLSWPRMSIRFGRGIVASLARPGGNITGLANLAPELSGKQLELLKETVSRLCACRLRDFQHPEHRTNVKRDGTCSRGTRSEGSILGRT